MILTPILELRKTEYDKPVEFYRYDIDGTKVWFDQYIDTGHIYAVYVKLNPKYFSGKINDQEYKGYQYCSKCGQALDWSDS